MPHLKSRSGIAQTRARAAVALELFKRVVDNVDILERSSVSQGFEVEHGCFCNWGSCLWVS